MKKPGGLDLGSLDLGDMDLGNLSLGSLSLGGKVMDDDEEPHSAEEITQAGKEEIGEQLRKIKEFEARFKEQWDFDGESGYYFAVCFKSKDERNAFLKRMGIKLRCDNHVFFEEIKDVFRS